LPAHLWLKFGAIGSAAIDSLPVIEQSIDELAETLSA
jgi:hypothetical protein